MIDVKRNGDKITITFDLNAPFARKVIGDLHVALRSAGLKEDSTRISSAMFDDPPGMGDEPPEIDPGG